MKKIQTSKRMIFSSRGNEKKTEEKNEKEKKEKKRQTKKAEKCNNNDCQI